jgi:myo-inositol-1(or 4)-monophosphatase
MTANAALHGPSDLPCMITTETVASILKSAAVEFGRLAAMPADVKLKSDGSFLTAVDEGMNAFLYEALTQIDPAIGWLSEEKNREENAVAKDAIWIVDPLDGTKEFVRNVPEYAISIGLLYKGRAIAGGVINPANGVGAATGTDGSLLSWNTDLLMANAGNNETDDITHAAISVSRTEVEDGTIVKERLGLVNITPVGSVAYKLMRVACNIDALSFSLQPKSLWDICGGIALLAAAGKRFYRLDGNDNTFDTVNTRIKMGYIAGREKMIVALKPLLLQVPPII